MSDTSKIEWTDATWNPVRGCIKVSPGCANCYAETFAERFRGVPGHPYEQGFDLRLVPEKLTEPLSWKKPRRVFVNSMSDLFQDGVGVGFVAAAFGMMQACPQHTFQVLTKRPETMRQFFQQITPDDVREFTLKYTSRMIAGGWTWPLPNVWLGVSVENQHFADERIPLLLQTPAAIRFISAEPLLEAIDLHSPVLEADSDGYLDWVIVGGESGPGARPFNVAWARSIVAQCKAAGVACFVKQLGANVRDRNDAGFEGDTPTSWPMDTDAEDLDARGWQGDAVRIRLRKKGGSPKDWPQDLRIRQFPEARR